MFVFHTQIAISYLNPSLPPLLCRIFYALNPPLERKYFALLEMRVRGDTSSAVTLQNFTPGGSIKGAWFASAALYLFMFPLRR